MRTTRVLAVLMIAVLGLAGCSSKKSSGTALALEAQDFKFAPATLDAKAGEKVTVTFTNGGNAEHNFSISSLKVNTDLAKGKTTKVTFTAPATAGDLQFFCEYHKDSKNMVGTLHVT